MKDHKDMTLPELFKQFANDITCDAHGTAIKYSRSDSQKELSNRASVETLTAIIKHLREVAESFQQDDVMKDLGKAWQMLISDMSKELEINTSKAPNEWDITAWCDVIETSMAA